MKKYNKLVRDRIPELIKKSGKTCKTRRLSDDEYRDRLKEKLTEEVGELLKSPCVDEIADIIELLKSPCVEEIADIIEVLEAISSNIGSSLPEVIEIKEKKRRERGGFSKRIFLEHVNEIESSASDRSGETRD
jgi:predicted house-cleaning noncanonical NTP pyrophosphatase (MazG superfamily)